MNRQTRILGISAAYINNFQPDRLRERRLSGGTFRFTGRWPKI
jgi:hypothetical protein